MKKSEELRLKSLQKTFQAEGVVPVQEMLPPAVSALIADYAKIRVANSDMDVMDDGFVDMALTNYGDYMTESLLIQMTGVIEKIVGIPILPTYSYLRYYRDRDSLPVHIDRMSCQYGVTLHCGHQYETGDEWPIFIKNKSGKKLKIVQDPGDAVVYMGCDLDHWRDKIPGGYHIQVHLHYIGKDEPYADELVLDARYRLGQNYTSRNNDIINKYFDIQKSQESS